MKKIAVTLALALVACGQPVEDTDTYGGLITISSLEGRWVNQAYPGWIDIAAENHLFGEYWMVDSSGSSTGQIGIITGNVLVLRPWGARNGVELLLDTEWRYNGTQEREIVITHPSGRVWVREN